MLRSLAAAVLLLLMGSAAPAELPVPQLMGERLRAGELSLLEQDLTARLTAQPADDQARFALGATQFIRTVEQLTQNMYRYGLQPPRAVSSMLPFFRFPLPPNPKPDTLDYEKMRGVFRQALDGFGRTEATLSPMGQQEVKLPIALGLARLDLDGNGTADEQERLWRVFDATLGGGNIPPEAAERFIIAFDRGDAAWLRGYAHLLSALIEFMLAHDGRASFDVSAHMLFPGAGLPNADLDRLSLPFPEAAPIADIIAAVHMMRWEVKEPERMKAAHAHLQAMAKLSYESWRHILAETDDEAEWIPSPSQRNGAIPNAPVTAEMVEGWMMFLSEFEDLLDGRKLLPHWRLSKGINLRRVFLEPRTFDPVLWAQGSAALPYLEDGPLTTAGTWQRIMQIFGGNFLGYAVWFN